MSREELPQRGKHQHWTHWAAANVGTVVTKGPDYAIATSEAHPHIQIQFSHKTPRKAVLIKHQGPFVLGFASVNHTGEIELWSKTHTILNNIDQLRQVAAAAEAAHKALKKYSPKK